ncbi:hypothetical protein [Actinophytocola xinjiangensis]|uniref:hypothetical protein n=1 Tax=Actinophytocola xinjiangensis TaxID=485602 RepID=UPI0012B743A9|nr:hypothetical protein [Actinophytocola xinjiangensis]
MTEQTPAPEPEPGPGEQPPVEPAVEPDQEDVPGPWTWRLAGAARPTPTRRSS